MRILVTGKNGQLARSLAAGSCENAEIICVGRPQLDLTDKNSVEQAVAMSRPDIVINAAAYTHVDQAETDEVAAMAVNARGAEVVAQAAAWHGLPLIHVSTDYVFDGFADGAYREVDAVAPVSVYGQTKLAGETRVAAAHAQSVIVRTAWLVSPYGANFCKTMLRLARTKSELPVVADQVGSPTYVPHLARALVQIAKRLSHNPDHNPDHNNGGIYHVANQGYASWFEVAGFIMTAAAKRGHRAAHVRAISSDEYPTPVRRPANSRLDCAKAKEIFGIELPHWTVGIDACVQALVAETDCHDDLPTLDTNNANRCRP